MQAGILSGRKILLLEDEYFLADEIRRTLTKAGAVVVGPLAQVAEGLEVVDNTRDLSCAILDLNLREVSSLPVAEALRRRDIPFMFTTGYDKAAIPTCYHDVARLEKPISLSELVRVLAGLARSQSQTGGRIEERSASGLLA